MKKLFLLFLPVILGFLLLPGKVLAVGATLSLSPATKTVQANDTIAVDLVLDTGGQKASSVSAIINFDTTLLSATVTPGTFIDLKKASVAGGKITIDSGPLVAGVTGSGVLATINLRAIKEGTAKLTISFTGLPGSSVVLGANQTTNILDLVNNGVYTIGAGSSTSVPVSTDSATTTPVSGEFENTLALLAVGFGLVLFGIAGFANYDRAFASRS